MMSSAEELLTDMKKILGDLVSNARQMVHASAQAVSQKEIDALQERQEKLVASLSAVDAQLNKEYPKTISDNLSPMVHEIEQEIVVFEGLNADFIENIRRQRPVIQFEADKAKHHKGASKHPSGNATVDPKNHH